jgi:transcriptional regulator with XRE-family HTH domain
MSTLLDASAVRRQLALRGWTQAQLAQRAGINPTTLSLALHRGRPVAPLTFHRLATALADEDPPRGSDELLLNETAVSLSGPTADREAGSGRRAQV